MRKRNALIGALPILAKMLGQKLGVKVVVGARQAETDGKTIFLPPLPAESESLAILANGYIDHEAAHIRYTDFAVEKPPGLTGEFLNLLEDIRIERALGAMYPGSRHNLGRLAAYLERQDPSLPGENAPLAEQVLSALSVLLRSRVLGQTVLEPAARVMEQRLDAQLPEGVVVKLLALAFEVCNTRSTADVLALAVRIVAMLQEEAKPQPPDSQSDQPAEQGSSSSESPKQGDSCADQSGQPAERGSSSESSHQGGSCADRSASSGSTGNGTPSVSDRQAALQDLLAATSGAAPDVGEKTRQRLNAGVQQESGTAVLAEYDQPPPNRDPVKCCAQARAGTSALRRRLATRVQASRDEDQWRSRRGHRWDTRQLYRVGIQDPAVFAKHHEHAAPNTAVAVLLDRSGSMRQHIGLANQAVLATLLALEEISGVASWAAAFPGHKHRCVIPLKTFAERARRVAGRFQLGSHGGTPLANALWRAAWELCQRPEPRKLLMVATDGKPLNVPECLELIARARASGIEVIGLGIGLTLDHVSQVFGPRDAVAIESIDELAPALFKVLEKRLIQQAA